jgi:hypothetical protein
VSSPGKAWKLNRSKRAACRGTKAPVAGLSAFGGTATATSAGDLRTRRAAAATACTALARPQLGPELLLLALRVAARLLGPRRFSAPAPPLEPELELGVATPAKSGAVKASNEMRQSHRSGRSARRRCRDFLREVVKTLEPRDERAVEALIVASAGTSRRQLPPAGISITRSDPMPHTHERRTGLLRPVPRRKGHQRRLRSG